MEIINVLLISEQGAVQETLIYYLKKLGYTYLATDSSQNLDTIFDYFNSYRIECVLLPLNTRIQIEGVFLAQTLQHLYQIMPIFYAKEINAAQITLLKQFKATIYVLRPIDKTLLYVTIELVRYRYLMNRLRKRKYIQKFFFVPQGSSYLKINFAEVLYIERAQKAWQLVLMDSKIHKTYTKIDQLISRLPPYFVKCHTSYIVNLEQVKMIRLNDLILCNDISLPLENPYRKTILQSLFVETTSKG